MSTENKMLPDGVRVCPYYATRELKMFGLSTNTLICSFITFGLLGLFINPFVLMLLIGGIASIIERLATNYPPAYVHYKISILLNTKVVKFLPWFPQIIADIWRKYGSIPPPQYKNHYEP